MEKIPNFADTVTKLCIDHYENLPKTGKPNPNEWTILGAIVLVRESTGSPSHPTLSVVSMGTGSKCIGQGKLSSQGDIINDSHAEIMTRRGFLRYLYDQLQSFSSDEASSASIFNFNANLKLYQLKSDVKFVFYCSHTPCGDASIIPLNANLDLIQPANFVHENSSTDGPQRKKMKLETDIYRTGAKCVSGEPQDLLQPGAKEDYHVVGVLRTKPGRGDRTLSMSCSDKLAKWNIVGWQGALLMHFLATPVYVSAIVLGPCPFDLKALERALWGRLKHLEFLQIPFEGSRPAILQSNCEFPHAKKNAEKPAPGSIVWTLTEIRPMEVAVEGKKQGATRKSQLGAQGRLSICKRNLFARFCNVLNNIPEQRLPSSLTEVQSELEKLTYLDCKNKSTRYQEVWLNLRRETFKHWTRKSSDLLKFKNE